MDSRARAFMHLKKADPKLHRAALPHKAALPAELSAIRSNRALFERLCQTVVSQQLGTEAARAIFARLKVLCGGKLSPQIILKMKERQLRSAGLSGAKVKTLKAVANEVESGKLVLTSLRKKGPEEAISRLSEIWGIGPWSAEMFLMFALGHPDIFSAGDLGLARAIERIYGLPKGASREKLVAISAAWAPYRTFASLALWRVRDATPPPAARASSAIGKRR